jgi:hypothetical protein
MKTGICLPFYSHSSFQTKLKKPCNHQAASIQVIEDNEKAIQLRPMKNAHTPFVQIFMRYKHKIK